MQLKPPVEEDFTSPLRDEKLTARVGVWVGIAFGICFLTGLISHGYYLKDPWIPLPTRPVWGYRVTQGLHVASGTAAIPLLLVKLWAVFPKLFAQIPLKDPRQLLVHLLERGSIAVLVAAAITELAIGLANAAQWYPWSFHFRATHYALAWVVTGSLLLHIAVKLPIIRRALGVPLTGPTPGPTETSYDGPSRRALLRTGLLASGVAVLASAGSTVPLLRRVSIFGVRSGDGPGGVPINKSAKAAGVVATALQPDFRLTVVNGAKTAELSRADLEQLEQRTHVLPIACVEGWSANGRWTGVRLSDVLALVEAPPHSRVRFSSLQDHGPFRVTELPASFSADPLTLLALGLDGNALSVDHGYPCRLIAPNRPGVFQTKWVRRIEVLS